MFVTADGLSLGADAPSAAPPTSSVATRVVSAVPSGLFQERPTTLRSAACLVIGTTQSSRSAWWHQRRWSRSGGSSLGCASARGCTLRTELAWLGRAGVFVHNLPGERHAFVANKCSWRRVDWFSAEAGDERANLAPKLVAERADV